MPDTIIATILPGHLVIGRGTVSDFRPLERFHYRSKSPATWAGVWVVRYDPMSNGKCQDSKVAAAAVLSYPPVNGAARDAALGLAKWKRPRRLRWVNRHLRIISRVIVHPQFRGLGLAAALVRAVCRSSPTRYTEAFALMGQIHPFFEKGGMRRITISNTGPVYYLYDRMNDHAPQHKTYHGHPARAQNDPQQKEPPQKQPPKNLRALRALRGESSPW